MSEGHAEFPEDVMRNARKHHDPCPPAEELTSYVLGELDDERARAVKDHIDFCGICDLLVGRLEAADAAEDGEAVEMGESETRILAGLRPLLEGPGARPEPIRQPKPRWWLHPAFAYSVAMAALVVGYLVPRPAGPPAPQPTLVQTPPGPEPLGVRPAQKLQLDPTRAAGEPIRIRANSADIILSFVLPFLSGSEYTAYLIDKQGRASGEPQRIAPSADGYFYVVVPRERVAPGEWRLQVSERGPAAGREFVFFFTVD